MTIAPSPPSSHPLAASVPGALNHSRRAGPRPLRTFSAEYDTPEIPR